MRQLVNKKHFILFLIIAYLCLLFLFVYLFTTAGHVSAKNLDEESSDICSTTETYYKPDQTVIMSSGLNRADESSQDDRYQDAGTTYTSLAEALYDVKDTDKIKLYCAVLEQTYENMFTELESIDTADAVIICDESLSQYSINFSLSTNRELTVDEIKYYKDILSQEFTEVLLFINGECM